MKFCYHMHLMISAATVGLMWMAPNDALAQSLAEEPASYGVQRKPDNPADVADPISAASGAFSWHKTLIPLGGPMELDFSIHYRTDANLAWVRKPGDFPLGHSEDWNKVVNPWSWQPAPLLDGNSWNDMTVYLDDGGQVCFQTNAIGEFVYTQIPGTYIHPASAAVNREYQLKKIDNWFYFCDPIRGRVTMFQLLPSGGTRYRPETVMDRNTNRLTYSYAAYNIHLNPSRIEDDDGRALGFSYEWYQEGYSWRQRLAAVSNHVERVWTFVHTTDAPDNNNRTTFRAVIEPDGQTNTFIYTPNDLYRFSSDLPDLERVPLLLSVAEPLGNRTFTNEYTGSRLNSSGSRWIRCNAQSDAYGNRLTLATTYSSGEYHGSVLNADGTTARFTHPHKHDAPATAIRDETDQSMVFTVNTNMFYASATDREGATTTFGYDATGRRLTGMTNALGDGVGIVWESVTQEFHNPATDHVVSFVFDQIARIDYPDGTFERFAYDGRGNLTSRTDRAGAVWTTTYDDRGRPLTSTRPDGGALTRTWSANGLLLAVADSDGVTKTYGYDDLFRVISVTNANGAVRHVDYDIAGRIARITDELGQETQFSWDANGNLIGVTDSTGYTVEYERDLMNREVRRFDTLGTLLETEYDVMGRIARLQDPAGTNHLHRDVRGWVTNLVRGARAQSWAYDSEGRITNSVSPMGNRYGIGHDALGRPVLRTDPLGQTTAIGYDVAGGIASIANPLGAETRYAYDGAGRLVAVTNAAGSLRSFAYDAIGFLVSATDFDGHATVFAATPMGRLAAVTNALGQATRFTYDAHGRRIRTDYADGTRVTLTYDAAGRVAAVSDEATNVWSSVYDALGRVVAVTNPAGGVTSIAYHSDGTIQTTTDSDTGVVSNRYDAARRLVETVWHDGSSVLYAYNEHHELVAVTDALGCRTEFDYDLDGRPARITDGLGQHTHFGYDAAGRLTNRVDRAGAITSYEYDAAGRLLAVTDPTGVRTLRARDVLGRVTNITIGASSRRVAYNASGVVTNFVVPSGRALTYVADALQRIVRTVDALGETNAVAYDARGRIAAVTDPAGRVTHYAYDPRGPLAGVTLPGDESVSYQWNEIGRLSRVFDFNGAAWDFAYTPMGRLLSLTDPLDRVTRYAYDARGRLADVEWADGQTADYERDANGAVVRIAHSDGLDLRFGRDALGRLTNVNDIAFVRDPEGRIVATDNPGAVFGASYDAAGRLASATYPVTGSEAVCTVSYSYAVGPDGDGALVRVSDDLTGTQIDFAYDADLRLHTVSLPNGETIVYTWDAAERLVRLQSGHHVDVGLTYDRSGRVVEADFNAPLEPGAYITARTNDLTYDVASQLDGSDFEYDPRGRLTRATLDQRQSIFTWDDASRLVAMTQSNLNPHTSTYTYNGLGQTRTRADGTDMLRFHYNHAIGTTPIVAEQDAVSGQMLRYYVWTPAGRLLYMIDAAAGNPVYFYHFDPGGNTLALTDTNAAVTDAWAYDPYGRIVARNGSHSQPFTFDGAWGVRQDGDDGLYQMRARWYDALSARFLSPEPIWPQLLEPKALNPYQYAAADPIRFADPSGLGLLSTLHIYDPAIMAWFDKQPAAPSSDETARFQRDINKFKARSSRGHRPPNFFGSLLNTLHFYDPALAEWMQEEPDAPSDPGLSKPTDMIAKNLRSQFEQLEHARTKAYESPAPTGSQLGDLAPPAAAPIDLNAFVQPQPSVWDTVAASRGVLLPDADSVSSPSTVPSPPLPDATRRNVLQAARPWLRAPDVPIMRELAGVAGNKDGGLFDLIDFIDAHRAQIEDAVDLARQHINELEAAEKAVGKGYANDELVREIDRLLLAWHEIRGAGMVALALQRPQDFDAHEDIVSEVLGPLMMFMPPPQR